MGSAARNGLRVGGPRMKRGGDEAKRAAANVSSPSYRQRLRVVRGDQEAGPPTPRALGQHRKAYSSAPPTSDPASTPARRRGERASQGAGKTPAVLAGSLVLGATRTSEADVAWHMPD
ncbi:hypothetical protein PAL_GLEAN10003483 [Pteropus alecto]|uniref:Uncharacterized protein n=1 Tax=Pteropus alecto TaxID=9402 RepID=L5JY18_PTEAL|nr:hypothetical protein PAL_GLEAN10003483 [Pteropus alecto]